jgi:4-hydroxy-2-oxoglutarate aldolase
MTRRPSGVLVPLTTPFDRETGDIAPVPLRENARAVLQAGVNGIVAGGSTGEASLLSDEEFRSVVGWLRDVVPEDRWLIAGTGRESTRATIAACKTAADEGADAVLVRPPGYYGSSLSIAAMTAHFRAVADASPVPVLLYNIPKYTHLMLSDAVLTALTDHANVIGAKDSSGDLKNFAAYRAAAPSWALFVGSGHLYYAALELGAVGGVLAAACFAVGLSVKIRDAFASGDKTGAGAAQELLAPVNKEIVGTLGVPGVKAAVDIVGLAGGPVRSPLKDLAPKDRTRITQLLSEAGVLAKA